MSRRRRKSTPSERFHTLMVTLMRPEHIAEIERRVAELSSNPGKVEWRDDPDPFGRNWDWVNTDVGARDDGAPPESVTL